MQEFTTSARPYAKAAFEYALAYQQLPEWSDFLQTALLIVKDKQVEKLLIDPRVTREQVYQFINDLYKGQLTKPLANFLRLLVDRQRLVALPQIAALFAKLKAEHEQTINVKVTSVIELTKEQQEKLKLLLEQRLSRKIGLSFLQDPSLLGGILIHAGDKVIDLSLNGQLKQLSNELRTA